MEDDHKCFNLEDNLIYFNLEQTLGYCNLEQNLKYLNSGDNLKHFCKWETTSNILVKKSVPSHLRHNLKTS